jgi:hypothetical protein
VVHGRKVTAFTGAVGAAYLSKLPYRHGVVSVVFDREAADGDQSLLLMPELPRRDAENIERYSGEANAAWEALTPTRASGM